MSTPQLYFYRLFSVVSFWILSRLESSVDGGGFDDFLFFISTRSLSLSRKMIGGSSLLGFGLNYLPTAYAHSTFFTYDIHILAVAS